MALNIVSQANLALVKANVNASDFVSKYNDQFYGRTILVPKGVLQIDSFAFDYRGDETIDIETEITDHWLEDNTASQDHIGVKPIIVTVKGFVAELNLSRTQLAFINKAFSSITNGLSQVNAYAGSYTPGAVESLQKAISQAQNIAIQIEQAAARAAQISSFFPSGPALNRQQAAYFKLSSLALARTIFTVATPFQVFNNMAIQSLQVTQPKETKGWSDFTVKMKQLNFTESLSLPSYSARFAGRAAEQAQTSTQVGSTQGAAFQQSLITEAFQ